jgi:hypothetical protein
MICLNYIIVIEVLPFYRSKPKMEQLPADEVQKNQADGGNKEQTEITSDSTTTAGKQTDNQVLGSYPEIA